MEGGIWLRYTHGRWAALFVVPPIFMVTCGVAEFLLWYRDMSNATLVSSERLVNPKTLTCWKCQGTGTVPYAKAGGRCFACGGSGKRRDRTRVVKEVRHTFYIPEEAEIKLVVNAPPAAPQESRVETPPPENKRVVKEGDHLIGLPWSEQARIRFLQRS